MRVNLPDRWLASHDDRLRSRRANIEVNQREPTVFVEERKRERTEVNG